MFVLQFFLKFCQTVRTLKALNLFHFGLISCILLLGVQIMTRVCPKGLCNASFYTISVIAKIAPFSAKKTWIWKINVLKIANFVILFFCINETQEFINFLFSRRQSGQSNIKYSYTQIWLLRFCLISMLNQSNKWIFSSMFLRKLGVC